MEKIGNVLPYEGEPPLKRLKQMRINENYKELLLQNADQLPKKTRFKLAVKWWFDKGANWRSNYSEGIERLIFDNFEPGDKLDAKTGQLMRTSLLMAKWLLSEKSPFAKQEVEQRHQMDDHIAALGALARRNSSLDALNDLLVAMRYVVKRVTENRPSDRSNRGEQLAEIVKEFIDSHKLNLEDESTQQLIQLPLTLRPLASVYHYKLRLLSSFRKGYPENWRSVEKKIEEIIEQGNIPLWIPRCGEVESTDRGKQATLVATKAIFGLLDSKLATFDQVAKGLEAYVQIASHEQLSELRNPIGKRIKFFQSNVQHKENQLTTLEARILERLPSIGFILRLMEEDSGTFHGDDHSLCDAVAHSLAPLLKIANLWTQFTTLSFH